MEGVESTPGCERWGCVGGSVTAERHFVVGQEWHRTMRFVASTMVCNEC